MELPSRLIGHQLQVRLHDDRLDVFVGGSALMTLPRGRAQGNGRHGHVVNYHHVIHALRRKPMALLNLVYRDQLFPRESYRRTFDALLDGGEARLACRCMVGLLALAHERGCEAALEALLEAGELSHLDALRERFGPPPSELPHVEVRLAPLGIYDALMDRPAMGGVA